MRKKNKKAFRIFETLFVFILNGFQVEILFVMFDSFGITCPLKS